MSYQAIRDKDSLENKESKESKESSNSFNSSNYSNIKLLPKKDEDPKQSLKSLKDEIEPKYQLSKFYKAPASAVIYSYGLALIHRNDKNNEKPIDDSMQEMSSTLQIGSGKPISVNNTTFQNNCTYYVTVVKRPYTYKFSDFVLNKCTRKRIPKKIFSYMTVEEKKDIMSLNFNMMWFRLNNFVDPHSTAYLKRKNAFEANWVIPDKGESLIKMVQESSGSDSEIDWELPKGRQKVGEKPPEAGIREFIEETGIPRRKFRILDNYHVTYSFIDDGVTYAFVFYLALPRCRNVEPILNLENYQQTKEVAGVKNISMKDVLECESHVRLRGIVLPLYNAAKKIYNGGM